MLVLTRKLGEAVFVGPDVEVVIVGISFGKVRLGFRAPRDVAIQRAEVVPDAESPRREAVAVQACDSRTNLSAIPPLRLFRHAGSV